MPFRIWEVVPPMGCSISPLTSIGLGWPLDVSRETGLDGSIDVSRETGLDGSSVINLTDSGSPRQKSSAALGWPETEVLVPSEVAVRVEPGIQEEPGPQSAASEANTAPTSEDPQDAEAWTKLAPVRKTLGISEDLPERPKSTRVLAVANQKGGVGKTTTSSNVAVSLALLGYRVLMVDMDPQGNATTSVGVAHPSGTMGTYEVLINGKSILDVVLPAPGIPGLSVVPATVDLAGAEIELVSEIGREGRLRTALAQYLAENIGDARFDFVVVDCPPSLGLLTVNALTAVDEVLIPLQCEYYALEGLGQLMGTVELVQQHLNPGINVVGILLTMYDGRTKLAPQVAEEARSHFPELVFEAEIPRSVRISEAPSYGESVLTYDPACSGSKAYLACTRELIAR